MLAAPSGSTDVIGASAIIAPSAPPAPVIAPRAPRFKFVSASRAQPKAPQNPAGDSAKQKQTVKRMALHHVAPAPVFLDTPFDDEIDAGNMFDDMPNRYEIEFR
jgi:hypothetical protein